MKTKSPTKISIRGLMFLALLICGGIPAFAQTPAPRANGKIAFAVSSVDGQRSGISVMNPDGSGRTQLTATQILCPPPNGASGTCGPDQLDYSPSWSPDGKQIAFLRIVTAEQLRNRSDVFVMNADGSNQQRLTQNGSVWNYSSVTWSPDGLKLAFVGPPVAGDPSIQIWVMNADGSNKHAVGPGQNPAWSPDGSKLAFPFNSFDSDNGIHVMNPDGSGRTKITTPNDPIPGTPWDADSGPVWSPDSTRILFIRYVGCEEFGDNHCQSITVWTVNPDGSNLAKVADIPADDLAWSPDGTKIVFRWIGVDGDDRDLDLFTMEPDGSNITRLTHTPDEYERMPSWQPLAPAGCGYSNSIDCPDFFIGQQYRDFLGREAEPSCAPNQCGLDFYLPIMNGCGDDVECIRYTRGALSANFFRSPEFGKKGAYVANLFNIVIGQRPKTVVELSDPSKVERPHYAEFNTDLASLSTPNDDPVLTEQKKDQLAVAWLGRTEVQAVLSNSLTNQQFVQKLETIAAVTLANESALIASLNGGTLTRAQTLRAVAESPEVIAKFYIQNFVTMEYFGYLRRDPEDCHASSDPSNCGYIFHNNRFNTPGADPDLIENFIVRGFIESPEYRGRFGLP